MRNLSLSPLAKLTRKNLASVVSTKYIIRYFTTSNITGECSIKVMIQPDWDTLFDLVLNSGLYESYSKNYDEIKKLATYNLYDEKMPSKIELKKYFINKVYDLLTSNSD